VDAGSLVDTLLMRNTVTELIITSRARRVSSSGTSVILLGSLPNIASLYILLLAFGLEATLGQQYES